MFTFFKKALPKKTPTNIKNLMPKENELSTTMGIFFLLPQEIRLYLFMFLDFQRLKSFRKTNKYFLQLSFHFHDAMLTRQIDKILQHTELTLHPLFLFNQFDVLLYFEYLAKKLKERTDNIFLIKGDQDFLNRAFLLLMQLLEVCNYKNILPFKIIRSYTPFTSNSIKKQDLENILQQMPNDFDLLPMIDNWINTTSYTHNKSSKIKQKISIACNEILEALKSELAYVKSELLTREDIENRPKKY